MKKIALISTILVLPAASLFAQSQSDIAVLRSRVESTEDRINLLERELCRLRGSDMVKSSHGIKQEKSSRSSYTVVKGDYLAKIAKLHHASVESIKKANGLKSDRIAIGQKLRIPSGGQLAAANTSRAVMAKDAVPVQKGSKHTVKSGETFYSIARDYKTSINALVAANPHVSPTKLRPGQSLNVARKSGAQSGATIAKTSSTSVTKPKPRVSKSVSNVVSDTPAKKTAKSAILTVTVYDQMTYSDFASKYGASTAQLNALNGLSLSKGTMLAKGSELYVPQY